MFIGALVMRDWPPFMSYVILLVLGVGLIRSGCPRSCQLFGKLATLSRFAAHHGPNK
jgi:hypothetical protein